MGGLALVLRHEMVATRLVAFEMECMEFLCGRRRPDVTVTDTGRTALGIGPAGDFIGPEKGCDQARSTLPAPREEAGVGLNGRVPRPVDHRVLETGW